jgi:ABC-type uncharacterized transport system substrate-binding protein
MRAAADDLHFRDFVQAGALMSYGLNVPALFRRAAELLDKILRGTKPADVPVEQPTTFRLVVNLKTAKAWLDDPRIIPAARRHSRWHEV